MTGFKFKRATLQNGLNIIGEIDHNAHTAAMGFFVKTGARDEESAVMGVSHFLEHMMFKGTETRTADDVNQQFDDIGANFNAFTSHETTAFWAHVLPEYIDKAEDILADILRPSLRQTRIFTSKEWNVTHWWSFGENSEERQKSMPKQDAITGPRFKRH